MHLIKYMFFALIILSCSNDDALDDTILANYISGNNIENGAVIACAASEIITNDVLVFYYPEIGAVNVKLYATENINVAHDNFSEYIKVASNALPVFNGYLEKRIISTSSEKWVIVTFELDKEIKLSNPIRIKHLTKPTVWSDSVNIDQSVLGMPSFSWEENAFGDNAIYFQVLTDDANNLLSGTYTFENNFQYYNISNVVLNITTQTPIHLISENLYKFTLMDVSLDNWVNGVIQKSFVAQ